MGGREQEKIWGYHERERSKLAQHLDIFLYKLYDSIQDKGVLTGKGKNTLFWEKDQEYWQLRRGIRVGGA